MNPTFKMPTHNTQDVAMLHNTLLTDTHLENTKPKNFHWNIGRIDFMELHTFFKNHDELSDCFVEDIAEEFVY